MARKGKIQFRRGLKASLPTSGLLPGEPLFTTDEKALYIALTPTTKQKITGSVIPEGVATDDILRWNASTQAWEVKSEPLIFNGIVLSPRIAALSDVEGGLFYKSTDKSVYVCTDAV